MSRISGSFSVAICALLLAFPFAAYGKSIETVLYSWDCFCGGSPGAIAEINGTFYGTLGPGVGEVFELAPNGKSWVESNLYGFCAKTNCKDGAAPNAGADIVGDEGGNLYGTTIFGGTGSRCNNYYPGCGTVWKLSPNGDGTYSESVAYSFRGGKDGDYPFTGLAADESGNFYGVTLGGGRGDCTFSQEGLTATGCGTVFKIAPDGSFTTLYAFEGGSDGANPEATLIIDKKGDLYGSTLAGGTGICNFLKTSGCGTVFEITRDGKEKQLYAFKGGDDGANPLNFGGLLRDKTDTLYGTTYAGGPSDAGTVFKLTAELAETVLYPFCSKTACSDGDGPWAGLTADEAGNLYGTAEYGGGYGAGVVFKLAPDGTETPLYSFVGDGDGSNPLAKIIADKRFKHLYGTAAHDGAGTFGVVYRINLRNIE